MKINIPVKINEREKKVLIIGGAFILLIVAFQLFTWYDVTNDRLKDYTDDKYYMLQKQLNRIANSKNIEARTKRVEDDLKRLENTLLQGNTPPVAAAALQKFLKDTAGQSKIDVKLERTLNPVVLENYLAIPVEIGFSTSTGNLQTLMVNLRKSAFLLTVSEIKIRVTNISKPEEIYTTLVVTGFIRNTENEQATKEAKHAA